MESNLPATFPGDFVLLPGEEIKRIFYAQKLKRIPKWHPQNIATIPVRSIAPNAAWVQDPELTQVLTCVLTNARIVLWPNEVDVRSIKKWHMFFNATMTAMSLMGATLRPDQMIRLSIAKRKAKEGLKRLENFDYKLLEIPLLAVQAAEVIDWKLRKYVGPLRLRLVELPAHLEREGGLVFQCGEKMMTALGIQLPYELINVELADCINSCLD